MRGTSDEVTTEIYYDLGLVGDGDAHALIQEIECVFAVDFGDDFATWWTIGDIEAGLLARLPPADRRGRCATLMAFYTIRQAFRAGRDVRPTARLATLREGSRIAILGALERDLGLRMPEVARSIVARVGQVMIGGGAMATFIIEGFAGRPWPSGILVIVGAALIGLDRGSFGQRTIGDLAKDVALLNYGAFVARDADRRAATLWRVLRHAIGRQTGRDPSRIARETALFDR